MNGSNGQNWALSIGGAGGNAVRDSDFLSVIAEVASDRYKAPVLRLRAVRDEVEKKAIAEGLTGQAVIDRIKDATDPLKKRIPGVMWSGTFTKRHDEALIQHSGLVHVDLDKLGSSVESWREQIIQDEHTLYCMVSPSGTGLKVVYKCDTSKDHLESWRAAEHHVLAHFGLTADPSCKNVGRLCFLSWDPDAFYNPDATPLPYPPPAPEPDVHEPAPSATHTGLKPGDDYDNRGDWKSVLRKHGWTDHGDHFWVRPGKTQGISATWDMSPKHPKRLYVFTSSTHFPPDHHYRPWHIYAWLEHGGDYVAASKALYVDNYGDRIKPVQLDWEPEQPPQSNGVHPPDSEAKTTKRERDPFPTVRRRPSAFKVPADNDPSVLLGNRYLNRGDTFILSGTSGIGKSSLMLLLAVLWALNRPAFGIKPNGPLRSLIIQSEDSDGDVAEVLASIIHCLALTASEQAQVDERITIVTDRANRGAFFVKAVGDHIKATNPDLVWLNPLQAFMDGDITKGQDLGYFLREQLNGMNDCKFGWMLVHHTTKPATGKDRAERLWHEVMYDMAGGAEIINHARAIASLRPALQPGEFNLVLAKRGRRAGVTRQVEQGAGFREEPVTVIPLCHAKGTIQIPGRAIPLPIVFWENRAPDDPQAPAAKKSGRPAEYDFNDYRNVVPTNSSPGMDLATIHRRLNTNGKIPDGSIGYILKKWEKEGLIEKVVLPQQATKYRLSVFMSKGMDEDSK